MRISDWSSDVCSSDLAGIDARADYNGDIFHQKFIIRDSGGSRRALLTGSTNFTPTGTGSHGTRKNLNHLVMVHDQWVCSAYRSEERRVGNEGDSQCRSRWSP